MENKNEIEIEGLYGAIPIAIVADKKLKPSTKIAAIVIALSCSGQNGIGYRANKTIGNLCNLSDRAIQRAFSELQKQGYLLCDYDKNTNERLGYTWTFDIGKRTKKQK